MEEQIRTLLGNFENFKIIDFLNDDEVLAIDEKNINVQLRNGNLNIVDVENNFHPQANILISFEDKQINIYSKLRDMTLTNEIVEMLVQEFWQQFKPNETAKDNLIPQLSIPFRWDEFQLN